jgi:hypothetical protein
MALTKINGYPVFVTTRRINGRRETVYRGCGVLAIVRHMFWRDECEERAEIRQQRRAAWFEFERLVAEFNRELRSSYLESRRQVIQAVERLGFCYHRSSDFRLRRVEGNHVSITTLGDETGLDFATFKRGDRKRYPTLKAFDRNFTWRVVDPAFYEKARDHHLVLATTAIAQFVGTIVDNGDVDTYDLSVASVAIKAVELAGPNPSPAVKLAAEATAIAWLEATVFETKFMQLNDAIAWRRQSGSAVDSLDVQAADRIGRLADRAHRRFMQSLKLLSDVQKALRRVRIQTVTTTRSRTEETTTAAQLEFES